mgnify:CR=1 FL=1
MNIRHLIKGSKKNEGLPQSSLTDEDYRAIPIFINNRDLVSWPSLLIKQLSNEGYWNIIILDNDSTYPPLLAYYESTSAKVVRLGQNLGHRALWLSGILQEPEYQGTMYVLTDPDCVLADECPKDYLRQLHRILLKHDEIVKVGFSLCAWGWAYHHWEVEQGYFSNSIGDYAYETPVDTTFALYRANSLNYEVSGLRTKKPYLCRHVPWEYRHLSLEDLPDDYVYYLANALPISSISRLARQKYGDALDRRVDEIRARHSV